MITERMSKRRNDLRASLVLFAVVFAIFAGCEREPARSEAPASIGTKPPAGKVKISALIGLPGETEASAMSAEGRKRAVRQGDTLAAGESLEIGPRCEALLELGDGTIVHAGSSVRLSLANEDGAPDIDLSRGAIVIARTPGSGPLAVRRGKETIPVPLGRTSIAADGEAARLSDYAAPLYAKTSEQRSAPEALRGIGSLTARLPGSGKSNEEALELASHDVRVVLRDGVAETRIEEAFVNRSGRTVEATYRFVAPPKATITRLALEVNGRVEEGEVLERSRAKKIFRQIVEDSVRPRDPALLEWERGSAFTMKIFPIAPGETRRVYLSYIEPALQLDGAVRYIYPLGGPAGTPSAGRFSIDVDLESSDGIAWVATPLYPSEVRTSGDAARVSFSADKFAPSLDFILEYGISKRPAEARAAVQTEPNGASHAMILVAPKSPATADSAATGKKTRLLAVVDTSYGTQEPLRDLGEALVLELFAGMSQGDEVGALACDSGCRSLSQRFEGVSIEMLDRARDFFDRAPPGGASDVLGALSRAFSIADDGVPTTIVYVGDGIPTAGETDPGRIVELLARTRPANVRVSTVSLGPDVDALLLSAIADAFGGEGLGLALGESPAKAARDLARHLRSPGLTNVSLSWPRGVRAAYPERVGFIPDGAEVAFFAELDGGELDGDVVLRGTSADGSLVERRYDISARSEKREHGFIGTLFARALIDHLELEGGAAREIIEISRRMRVASRETSWIVLENQRMYDRFGVQRTAAGEWSGEGAAFSEAVAEGDEAADDALDALAALDDQSAGDEEAGALTGRAGGGSGSAAGGKAGLGTLGTVSSKSAPAPFAEEKEETARAKKSSDRADTSEAGPAMAAQSPAPTGGIGTGYASAPLVARPSWDCRTPSYDIRISRAASETARETSELSSRGEEVRARPLSRTAHKRYVAALSRAGRTEEEFAAAGAWLAADPLDPGALTAYADGLARMGDRFGALRAYASVAEIEPTRAANHLRVAKAFEALGAFDAAAPHYRSASALDAKGEDASTLRYLTCLAAAGMRALFEVETAAVIADPARSRIRGEATALLNGARSGLLPVEAEPKVRGELILELSADEANEDLDLAVVDPAGRRISGLFAKNAVAASLAGNGGEILALDGLMNGRYRVLVSRTLGATGPTVEGTVSIRVRGERRSFPFSLTGAEAAVADVRYKKVQFPCYDL